MSNFKSLDFGEITCKGGLSNSSQRLKLKYLLPTEKYEGKASIEIIASSDGIYISKDVFNEIIYNLGESIKFYEEERATEIQDLIRNLKTKTGFSVRSFRFNQKDFILTQQLIIHLAELFGYLMAKEKIEYEKVAKDEGLIKSRNAMIGFLNQRIGESLLKGFNRGIEKCN